MDLFTGTVAATAETWKFRNAAGRRMTTTELANFATSDYLRAFPATSDYLAGAVSPVPWPTRTEPRQVRAARPQLGKEQQLTGSKRLAAETRLARRPI
jgi:hypothetical protein